MQSLLTEPIQKTELKYPRLVERANQCLDLYRDTNDILYAMEEDSICHLFECKGLETYEQIASFCKEHEIERVIDIGCAHGHQSEVFLQQGLDYVGVNEHRDNFWNGDKFQFICNHYPCKLPTKKGDLGVSVLCLTWNVYLYERKKTLTEQCEALQRDFEHCLLYMMPERVDFLSRYFKKVQKIDEGLGYGLYYFSNK
ncbi:hypothetical protein PP175_29575 (plasmid) [Aneurinibacillus sp. Ricciae_BoGa-3]|uniref:hypothetical protein n=1 Tax=Aneurinibacillus sp. Ricciae_BoGa-3 TaxID=3022697 RepID=UPI002340103B|nr:hypothetical protein [Aneurinibacillus sp. Ricciae_BoGa-3]WCK57343.1 hypothetical protein PP175_29575 [Aneurinibacillus sp. Ricciae_BoGa-3]